MKQDKTPGISPEEQEPGKSKGNRPSPTFSKFEDGILSAVRNLNRDPALRAEIAAKIS